MARPLYALSGSRQLTEDDLSLLRLIEARHRLVLFEECTLIGAADGSSPQLPVQRLRDYVLLGLLEFAVDLADAGCLGKYRLTLRGRDELLARGVR